MEFSLGGLVWRVLLVVAAVLALVFSRRTTVAQRVTEAIGVMALVGAAWVLVLGPDLQVFSPFVAAAAVAFGLLSVAEARH